MQTVVGIDVSCSPGVDVVSRLQAFPVNSAKSSKQMVSKIEEE